MQLEIAALTVRSTFYAAVDAAVDYVSVEGRSTLSALHEGMKSTTMTTKKDAMRFMQGRLLLCLCPQHQSKADE
jgi:hypothetical protein